MDLTQEQINELAHLGRACREAKAMLDNVKAAREKAIKRIAAQGAGYRSVGKAAGVSYQRVAQIVSGREPASMAWDSAKEVECPKCGALKGQMCTGKAAFHLERHHVRQEMFLNDHPWLR